MQLRAEALFHPSTMSWTTVSANHLLFGALSLGEKPVVIYNYIPSTMNNMAFIGQVCELRLIVINPHVLELI